MDLMRKMGEMIPKLTIERNGSSRSAIGTSSTRRSTRLPSRRRSRRPPGRGRRRRAGRRGRGKWLKRVFGFYTTTTAAATAA